MSSSRVLVFLIIFGLAYYGLTSMYISAYGGVLPPEDQRTLEAANIISSAGAPEVLDITTEIIYTSGFPIPIDIRNMLGPGEIAAPTSSSLVGTIVNFIDETGKEGGVYVREIDGRLVTSGIDDKKYCIFTPADNPGLFINGRFKSSERLTLEPYKTSIFGRIEEPIEEKIYNKVLEPIMANESVKSVMEAVKDIRHVIRYDWGVLSSIFKGGFGSSITDGAIISMLWCLFLGVEIWDRLPSGGTVGTLLKYGVGLGIFAFILLPLPAF